MAKSKVTENSFTLEYFKKILKGYKEAKDKIEDEFNLDLNNNFNFFEAISDTYKKENLHSDLMKQILDPTTKEIGNISYLKSFLKIIGVNDFDDLRNVKVERERNRIDILIANEDNAIIIENKINNAPDQDKQLERYYKKITDEEKKTVQKIVYITLSSVDNSKPSNLCEYDNNSLEKIRSLLIHLPAVSKDTKKKSLINWLDECIKKTPENNIGKIFLEQYKQLLAYLGGDVLMLKTEENCIKEIFANKNNIDIAKNLVDMWNKKAVYLCSAIATELEFENYTTEENYRIYAQKFNSKVNKYFCARSEKNNIIEIGFYIPSDSEKKKFTEKDLGFIKDNYNFDKDTEWNWDGKWIYMQINSEDYIYIDLYTLLQKFFDSKIGQRNIVKD